MAFSPINLLDLSEKIEQHQINRERGASEDIQYRYRHSKTIVDTKAFVSYGELRSDKNHERQDETIFYLVNLPNEPKFHDSIKYDGKVFLVEEWRKHNKYSTLYDLVTLSELALKNRRRV